MLIWNFHILIWNFHILIWNFLIYAIKAEVGEEGDYVENLYELMKINIFKIMHWLNYICVYEYLYMCSQVSLGVPFLA